MRYVAFIDTLGFKQKLAAGTHNDAIDLIKSFNRTIYELWSSFEFQKNTSINGRTFSDSIIIHSDGNSLSELEKILEFIVQLYRKSIITCDLPLRGGLAFGNYEDIPATEFRNLQKGLIVGKAFVDAYILESSKDIKGSKLLFGQEICLKIERNFKKYEFQKVKTDSEGNTIYELKWGDLAFLAENNHSHLYKFIELATKSKWLDHYYGTLETFLIKESVDHKNEVFSKIIKQLKSQYKYSDLDNFIENYLKSESATYTKRSFLSYIRKKI